MFPRTHNQNQTALKAICLTVICLWAMDAISSPASAQNPLRVLTQSETTNPTTTIPATTIAAFPPQANQTAIEIPPEVKNALYQSTPNLPKASIPISEAKLIPTQTQETDTPQNADLEPVFAVLDNLQTYNQQATYVESNANTDVELTTAIHEDVLSNISKTEKPLNDQLLSQDPNRMRMLAEKLIFNTLIVLCCGVGFIFVAKQWMRHKQPGQKNAAAGFEVKSSLVVAPKSKLLLVNLGSERLVVATDPTGVKAVIRLTDSFSQTLDSIGDATGQNDIDENLTENFTGNIAETFRQQFSEKTDEIVPPASNDDPNRYSLASLGRTKLKEQPGTFRTDGKDEIRRKMEEALAEHGLKDVILKNLRTTN